MERLFAFAFLSLSSLVVSAQTQNFQSCGTEDLDTAVFKRLPWFGNDEYIDNFIDSMGYPLSSGDPVARVEGGNIVRYRIPVNFIIYRNDNAVGGPNAFELQRLIDKLNNDHRANNTGIRFYQKCNVNYVNDSDRLRIDAVFGTWWGGITAAEAVHSGMLNVHIVESINVPFSSDDPPGLYNPTAVQSVFIDRGVYSNSDLASTLTHEVGHFLELAHTHQYQFWRGWPIENCVVEPIDRNRRFADITFCEGWFRNSRKCSSTGDALCDTPADPKDDPGESDNCVWVRDLNDIYGDSYLNPPVGSFSPNPHNIMSYGDKECRDLFTRQQIGVMVHSIEKGRHFLNGIGWRTSTEIFDTFEPDNEFLTARKITVNDLDEHRTFHQSCDEDWVTFTAIQGRLYTILTKEVTGESKADTEIFLFKINAGNLTLIASHNNISSTNKFSQIAMTLSPGEYAIQVKRINPSGTQHYKLQISDYCYDFVSSAYSITDQSTVCTSNKQFTLNNRYPGSSVIWSNSSNTVYVSGQGTSTYTIKAPSTSISGAGWVSVTTTYSGCIDIVLPNEVFWVGKPSTPQSIFVDPTDCPEYYFSTACTGEQGITSYTWQYNKLPYGTIYTYPNSTCDSRRIVLNSGFSYNVGVKAINACGESQFRTTTVTVNCGGSFFTVYPNPSTSEISFEVQSGIDQGSINEMQIVILNDSGNEIIRRQEKVNKARMDVSQLKRGTYFYRIKYGALISDGRFLIE